MLTFGDLAKSSGVKAPTIRYYEQMGLLTHTERSEGSQRRYSRREQGLTIEARMNARAQTQTGLPPNSYRLSGTRPPRLKKLETELERIATHCHRSPGSRLLRHSGAGKPRALRD